MTEPAEDLIDPVHTEIRGADTAIARVTVDAPARLTMSWQWTGETAVTHVAIELSAVGDDRTEVVITHSANPSTTDRDDHEQGWRDCLGRLVREYSSRGGAD